jgi:hypothetical protein
MQYKSLIAGALVGAMIIGGGFTSGCQPIENIAPDELDPTPIPVDPAMARRDWELSYARYEPTGVISSPTLFSFYSQPYSWGGGYSTTLTELPLFGLNVLLIPYQIFASPAWREREYRAATIPPTYTAMPPLPPSDVDDASVPPASPVPEEQLQPVEGMPQPDPAREPAPDPTGKPAPAPRT